MVSPSPAARASQSARMVAKPRPLFHCASRPGILTQSEANSASAETIAPAASEIGRRVGGRRRMGRAIDADADGHGSLLFPALAFDQDAGELGARQQQVVRPFQLEHRPDLRGTLDDRVVNRKRRHERKLRPMLGRSRVRQQQAGVQIAGNRNPAASAPAAAGALSLRGDPQAVHARPAASAARLPHWSSRSRRWATSRTPAATLWDRAPTSSSSVRSFKTAIWPPRSRPRSAARDRRRTID